MSRHPKEYQQFDRLMGKLLTVSKETLDERLKRHRDAAKKNPRRPGPKPKSTRAS